MDKIIQMKHTPVIAVAARALALGVGLCATLCAAEPFADDIEFFEKQVRPVLVETCQKCHGARKQEGGLRLDSRAALLKGGDSGVAVEPGKPAESILVEAVGYTGEIRMNHKAKIATKKIAAL